MPDRAYYIEIYSSADSQPHHSLSQEMRNRGAIDAVYATAHPDLAPRFVAYVYDDSDDDSDCYSWLLTSPYWSSGSLPPEMGVEDTWISSSQEAVVGAHHAVETALQEEIDPYA